MAGLGALAYATIASAGASTIMSVKNRPKSAPRPPVIERPDMEQIKLARRKAEAARLGSGRASTILSQNSTGTLGPSG